MSCSKSSSLVRSARCATFGAFGLVFIRYLFSYRPDVEKQDPICGDTHQGTIFSSNPWLFDARRVGTSRSHLARLASQRERLARKALHHPVGLWRDGAEDCPWRNRSD